MKTNAARQLESLGIAYELREYEVDLDDLSATSVAAKVGLDPAQVFKTLVCRGDRHGICLALVPADAELDGKALAKLTGDRKVEPVALKDVQPLTGQVRGGVSALGGRKRYPVWIDASFLEHARVAVSAGTRGAQLLVSPHDWVRATDAKVGSFARRLQQRR